MILYEKEHYLNELFHDFARIFSPKDGNLPDFNIKPMIVNEDIDFISECS